MHAPLIVGTVGQKGEGKILNSAIQISPDGQLKGRYDKIFLVPFGEYIPFPFKGIVGKITKEIGDFEPGERVSTFDLGSQRSEPLFVTSRRSRIWSGSSLPSERLCSSI